MSSEQLESLVRRHNRLSIALAVILVPAALLLWVLAWGFAYCAVVIPLDVLGYDGKQIGFWAAWAFVAVLLFEGLTQSRKLFDLGEYANSSFYMNSFSQSDGGYALNHIDTGSLPVAWWTTQLLFCAPHLSLEAIGRFRSLISVDRAVYRDAARLLAQLRASREWTAINECDAMAVSIALLRKFDLVWLECRAGEDFVRYPAGIE